MESTTLPAGGQAQTNIVEFVPPDRKHIASLEEGVGYIVSGHVSDAQFLRRDVLDGKAVMVYSYSSLTRSGDVELHIQTEIWVGEADGLPYQTIINGEILTLFMRDVMPKHNV